jgi:5,10-methylene-tetrahydrofolate dehydrogenase/methenyl tetrahydrofolate cyclohydrolase
VTARILDGRTAAAAVKDDLRARVKTLAERGVVPGLGTVLVGDDPGSRAYVEGKHRDCAEVGIASTVTLCHTGTRDVAAHTRRSDIVVAAVGVPGLITADMVKPGATVVDVGITRVVGPDGKGRYTGDVAPEVREVAGALVPVPGGVGPMTRAMLLTNVVERAEWLSSR